MNKSSTPGLDDILHIKEWIKKQPHLPQCISDDQIKMFLSSCGNHRETSKKAIETYFTMKSTIPELFGNRTLDDPGIQHIGNVCRFLMLPKTTPEGYRVMFASLKVFDPAQYFLSDALKYIFLVQDAYITAHCATPPGLIMLIDMKGFTFRYLARLNVTSLRNFFVYVQDAMPIKLKAMHIINVTPVITQLMALIRPFIQEMNQDLIQLHKSEDIKGLYKDVCQELLPKDYDGNEASVDTLHRETEEKIRSMADWFDQDEKIRTDEHKRLERRNRPFVTQGSFKKLDID